MSRPARECVAVLLASVLLAGHAEAQVPCAFPLPRQSADFTIEGKAGAKKTVSQVRDDLLGELAARGWIENRHYVRLAAGEHEQPLSVGQSIVLEGEICLKDDKVKDCEGGRRGGVLPWLPDWRLRFVVNVVAGTASEPDKRRPTYDQFVSMLGSSCNGRVPQAGLEFDETGSRSVLVYVFQRHSDPTRQVLVRGDDRPKAVGRALLEKNGLLPGRDD